MTSVTSSLPARQPPEERPDPRNDSRDLGPHRGGEGGQLKKADPFASAPAGIKPAGDFIFQALQDLPSSILGIEGEVGGVIGFAIGGLFPLLIPFLGRRIARGESSRLVSRIGIAVIVYMMRLPSLGYMVSPTG